MNSQWKNRNTRKVPPPISRMGADSSITFATFGSELNDAVKEPKKPNEGLEAHRITHGSNPLTRKTAIKIPQSRNHLLAFLDIVERTSALMMALSTLMIISNKTSPKIIRIIENRSIQAS